jgi:hypothetical protein
MTWEMEYTDEFGDWWSGHSERFMHSIPDVILGGDKTGDDRWSDVNVPIADRLYDEHLEELKKEGLIDD